MTREEARKAMEQDKRDRKRRRQPRPPRRWKAGDLCTVDGEGDTAFIVREVGPHGCYLARVDGQDGAIGHGREGFGKMHPLALADLVLVTTARRRR